VARKPSVQPFYDARGRLLIERRGLPRTTLANDAYHFLRTASWTRIVLLFVALFLGTNLLFAVVLWLGGASITNAGGFADYYWFSVQTLATIGYGVLAPNDLLSHVVVTIESMLGLGLTALMTGVFFARFATTSARIIFSQVAVVHDVEGKPTLMFRMANARSTAIVEATVRVYLTRDEYADGGERVRRIHDLELRRNTSPFFALSWTVYHVLDESSLAKMKSVMSRTPEGRERLHRLVVIGQPTALSWLMTVVRNACRRMLRPFARQRRALGDVASAEDGDSLAVAGESLDPHQALERWELVNAVHAALAALPRAYREVVILRDLEGLSGPETCAALGLDPAAMKTRLHRARASLRAKLDDRQPPSSP